MNEQEGALLAGETLDSEDAPRRFARRVLSAGPSVVIITRRHRGSETIVQDDRAEIVIHRSIPRPWANPVTKPGVAIRF